MKIETLGKESTTFAWVFIKMPSKNAGCSDCGCKIIEKIPCNLCN